ncbi:MAG: hypothetical protein JWP61_1997, partial [Friedmanniella sp.]|nr:hypothetical protein [Friedmanniella sp.]
RTSRLKVTKQKDGESGVELTFHPTKVLDSLVLADQPDPLQAVAWSSSDPENKVIGALRALGPLGPATQSDIVRQAENTPQPAISRALAALVKAGQVVRVGPAGRGARYELPASPPGGGEPPMA